MRALIVLACLVLVGCGGDSPLAPSTVVTAPIPPVPAAPAPAPPVPPPPTIKYVTCQDVWVRIYDGPDPDKAHARVEVPVGIVEAPLSFELRAYPLPFKANEVDSSGEQIVPPGETEEFISDRWNTSRRPDRREVLCNGTVIAAI